MTDLADSQRLFPELPARVIVRQRSARQDLDRDIALQPHVPRSVHDAHAARADLLDETEMTNDLPGGEGRRRHIGESYDGSGPRSTRGVD